MIVLAKRGKRMRRTIASSLALGLFLGCQGSLPTAPSELATGIVVYEHANFLGASAHITEDISDLKEFKGPCVESASVGNSVSFTDVWNDCISSVRVAPGWSATLYRGTGYGDDSVTTTTDLPNLQLVGHDCPASGLNDCVSSVRVRRQ
mgnify:CR=1 FL=1